MTAFDDENWRSLLEQSADHWDYPESPKFPEFGPETDFGNIGNSGRWEPVAAFTSQAPLPAFPADALPAWCSEMVKGTAEETQTPLDLPGVVCLGALAAVAGGRATVEVSRAWIEPVNLFAAVAMPPGSRKSAVFRIMTAPILGAERQMQTESVEIISEAKITKAVAEEAVAKAIRAAAKDGKPEAMAEVIDAQRIADSIQIPAYPRLIADDITPEALASLLSAHSGTIAVLSAEGDCFDIMSGRYNRGIANLGVFLKGHAGDLLLIDRKGREPERIERPALTITVCIQPGVLTDIGRNPVLRERGLLARVLYSLPADIVGYRKITPRPISSDVIEAYTGRLAQLAVSLSAWTDPAVLLLTPDAKEHLVTYQAQIEPRLRVHTGDLARLRDWASKLVGATVRIAGLLHLAENLEDGYGTPITADTMQKAITLGRYFTEHAMTAFGQITSDPVVTDATVILEWITREGIGTFSKRDAWQAVRGGRFGRASDLDAPLALLADHDYIRLIPVKTDGPGRKPSPRYEVNPASHNAQNPHNS